MAETPVDERPPAPAARTIEPPADQRPTRPSRNRGERRAANRIGDQSGDELAQAVLAPPRPRTTPRTTPTIESAPAVSPDTTAPAPDRPRARRSAPSERVGDQTARPFASLQADVERQLRERVKRGAAAPHPYRSLPWATNDADDDVESIRTHDVSEIVAEPEDDGPTRADLVKQVRDWVLVVGLAALVAVAAQTWVVRLYEIPSESMYPTLKDGDRVAVNKLSYKFGSVERGDLIVFKRPKSEQSSPDQPAQLIKRVIGLPGDVVEAREGVIYIDNEPLDETGSDGYLSSDVITNLLPQPVTVSPGYVFVLGDNREHSRDSRMFGPIPESDIIGRAMFNAWPPGRIGGFPGD